MQGAQRRAVKNYCRVGSARRIIEPRGGRPLQTIKNNIEPDEPPSPAPLRAYALRYTHLSASSLRSSGSGMFEYMCRGFFVTA